MKIKEYLLTVAEKEEGVGGGASETKTAASRRKTLLWAFGSLASGKARGSPSTPGPSRITGVGRVPGSSRKDREGIGQTALERWLATGPATQGGQLNQGQGGEVGKSQEGSIEKTGEEGTQKGE